MFMYMYESLSLIGSLGIYGMADIFNVIFEKAIGASAANNVAILKNKNLDIFDRLPQLVKWVFYLIFNWG